MDELKIDGTPWWRNVNMAKIEKAQQLQKSSASRPASRPVSRPASRPASPTSRPSTSAAVPSTSASAAPSASVSAAPVAPLSYVPRRRTELPTKDTINGGERLDINIRSPTPLDWYKAIGLDKVKRAPRISPSINEHLNKICTGIRKCNELVAKKIAPSADDLNKINDGIYRAFFLNLNAIAIRLKGLLFNDRGLPQIFNLTTINYPWYIKEDTTELYIKWYWLLTI